MHLARHVQWRFMNNINTTFNSLVGSPKQTLMVYSDVVESTVVGAQKTSIVEKSASRTYWSKTGYC